LNKYKRIFHHIDFKEAKVKHLEDLSVKKLEEERKVKQEKEISKITEEKKYSWRDTLTESEWVSLDTGGIANKTTQTFGLTDFGMPVVGPDFNQVTANFGGLGGVDVQPSEVGYNGAEGESQTTPPPTYNQLALAGFTKPLPMFRRQGEANAKEINSRLDAGQDFAQHSGADAYMNARLEDEKKKHDLKMTEWATDALQALKDIQGNQELEVKDVVQMSREDLSKLVSEHNQSLDIKIEALKDKLYLNWKKAKDAGTLSHEMSAEDKSINNRIEELKKQYKDDPPYFDPGANHPSFNAVTADDEKFLKANQTLVDLTKWMNNIGLPNDFAQWTLNYANNNMKPITKFSPGMERQVLDLVMKKFSKNPNATVVDIQYKDYGWKFDALPTRLGLGRFTATKLDNGDIKIEDIFNVDKVVTTLGAAQIVPGLQGTADRLVDIAYKRRSIGGVFDEGGIPIDVIIRKKKKKKKK
tara:strand:- start:59 stop:1468 length:1410 start_codon:yes stop_codon:yes gene_type:complete